MSGRLDGAGAIVFDAQASELPADVRHVVVDFKDTDYLSSAGLRELIKLGRTLKSRNGALILTAITPFVAQVLDLAGMNDHFPQTASAKEAAAIIDAASGVTGGGETVVNGRRYTVTPSSEAQQPLREWGSLEELMMDSEEAGPRITASLAELGCAFGFGGLGFDRTQAKAAHGMFLSTGRLLAVQPADGSGIADFLRAAKPDETLFHLSSALTLAGSPAMAVHHDGAATVDTVLRDISELTGTPDLLAFILVATSNNLHGRYVAEAKDVQTGHFTQREGEHHQRIAYIGVATRGDQGWPDAFEQPIAGYRTMGCACWFDAELEVPPTDTLMEALKAVAEVEEIRGVADLLPETVLTNLDAWIFLPPVVESATAKRLEIEVKEGDPLRDEWDAITRRIYHDASRVELSQLSGGYSATTYQAASRDKEGRRQLPTVLKISSLESIEREADAYHRYVEKFILNNSTVIMGRATRGHWAGLRYNFLGITGSEGKLSWLTHHYRKRPVEELDPIFEHLFTRILNPWYGQAREEPVALYDDNNPTHLFKGLLGQAKKAMGVASTEKTIRCDPLNMDLPNPYWVLKHIYPERAQWTLPWFSAITHGDLNMQNILLDEKENLYVIDFSETRPRNVWSDFARLEPIFKLEMVTPADDAELARLLRFEQGLLQVSATDETPPCDYDGSDPMVFKAHHTLSLLRKIACQYTPGRTDLVPYLLALLEWTYPVVYYAQLSERQRQYGMFSTALIAKRLLELTE